MTKRAARILVVGKFPPIQGGVSAQVFASVVDLAKAGHTVDVVTNSDEVEINFRCNVSFSDAANLAKRLSMGKVSVYSTTPNGSARAIPQSQFFTEKLYGLGCRLIEQNEYDFIVGWYLAPYGMVAAALATKAKKVLLLCHAGSDAFRLAQHADMSFTIKDTLRSAHRVLTYDHLKIRNQMDLLGVKEEKRIYINATALPEIYFPKTRISPKSVDASTPLTLLHYSKIGEAKGSFDLVRSLTRLSERKLNFQFFCVELGWPTAIEKFKNAVATSETLSKRTKFLAPVPPWEVNTMLSAADLVVCLERKFDIDSHSPKVPREVMAAGSTLIVSREVADKQPFSRSLVNKRTAIVVDDPNDIQQLDCALEMAISNAVLMRSIATQGRFISEAFEGHLPTQTAYATAIGNWWNLSKPAGK
ncbi:Glycosyltransferase involved in cell wall bisynthesis [Pseudomonas reinekei]|uniref:Glycosyltransferase family 4 protein n=1 Tax=Pseudomonas reinekei TaxID=395598 RepID=A0A1H0T0K2_PSERE|nr:glycosyltransferase [Pseudomonas reinekei]KAB0482025.1 glycosyltransferase family 4 protein [Pseudomonas reinekei]OLT99953.1 hypothetical protein BVK86_23905 [Pseudomonas reinekei]SDP47647.1 Glycosyltransferase involved in cell wall bisynthesis [Pseudomonas reinekei]